jgi:hypothetical protein
MDSIVMSDDSKLQGLNFGRSLQVVWKRSTVYSVDHPAVQSSLQQAFTELEQVLRGRDRFTLGFSDGRVLLDNILTADVSLAALEAEFKKREIAALVFSPGITVAELKKMLRLISVSPKALLEAGGIEAYLRDRQVANARIIPSDKKKGTRNSDVVLSVDSESFLATGGLTGQAAMNAGNISLDLLLKAAGLDVKTSDAKGLMQVVQTAVEVTAVNPEVRPESVIQALAMFLDSAAPAELEAIPGLRGQESMDPQQLASELWESLTAQWLGSRFRGPMSELQLGALQGEAGELLARNKNAGVMAERILARLARLFEEQRLPLEWIEPIRRELGFYILPFTEQKMRLLALKAFSPADFRRAIRAIKGLVQEQKVPDAVDLAEHCCKVLLADQERTDLECIPAVLELIPITGQMRMLRAATNQLTPALLQNATPPARHGSVASCLCTIAQHASRAQDFELVLEIAAQLGQSFASSPELHLSCCGDTCQQLIPAESIDQIINLVLDKGETTDKQRTATALLRQSEAAADRLFARLDEEPNAQIRLRVLRAAGQLRTAGIRPALKRLADERWYVVRNACILLAEMRDPELILHLAPLLRHPDERVQRAAFQSLQRMRLAACLPVYADALAQLAPTMLDSALDEIMLSRDANCIEGLCKLITQGGPERSKYAVRAVQIAIAIDAAACVALLGEVVKAPEFSETVRGLVYQAAALKS